VLDSNSTVQNGIQRVRIWQSNIDQQIIAHVPVADGHPRELGLFEEDGVTLPGTESVLEFIENAHPGTALLPTGNVMDQLDVPGIGRIAATLPTAGEAPVLSKRPPLA
jgi:2-methylaconitate cis-trans-isomerase PrpF